MQSSNTPSFYETLEVRRDASPREIRRSYLRLAQKYHPDLNPENEIADLQFKKIRQVYEILSDPIRRAAYDEKPASFHLDEGDSWSNGPIITEPVRRGDSVGVGAGCDSFQPNWTTTTGNVSGWLMLLAAASLAVAATVGVPLMLFLVHSRADQLQLPAVADTKPVAPDQSMDLEVLRSRDGERSITNEQDEGQAVPTRSTEPLASETRTAEPEWWTISVYDPEKTAQEWLSVESWDEGVPQIEEPEWTKLSVPDLQPSIDTDTPIEAPEWTKIPVQELQPPTELQPTTEQELPAQTVDNSSLPPVTPEWAEIPVPDLIDESTTFQEMKGRHTRTATPLAPQSIGSLYPHPHLPSGHAARQPNARPMDTMIRRQVESQIHNQIRPESIRAAPPFRLQRPDPRRISDWRSSNRIPSLSSRRESSDKALFMSETQDGYLKRYIPPVSRYGAKLPDVPPAYSVPTDSWRRLDGP